MESKDVKSDFVGFGPLPTTKTTYSQGIGMGGSFAPIATRQDGFGPTKKQDKIQIYSSGETDGQVFTVAVDNQEETAIVYLGNTELTEYLQLKTDTVVGESSVYGYSGNGNQNFALKADDTTGVTNLALFNEGNAEYLEMKIDGDSPEATIYGYADTATEYYYLKAKPTETQLYLFGDEHYVKIDIPDNAGVSLDAEWKEIDICVDGTPMKMKVLGTEPYAPPAP